MMKREPIRIYLMSMLIAWSALGYADSLETILKQLKEKQGLRDQKLPVERVETFEKPAGEQAVMQAVVEPVVELIEAPAPVVEVAANVVYSETDTSGIEQPQRRIDDLSIWDSERFQRVFLTLLL